MEVTNMLVRSIFPSTPAATFDKVSARFAGWPPFELARQGAGLARAREKSPRRVSPAYTQGAVGFAHGNHGRREKENPNFYQLFYFKIFVFNFLCK
jgi:hypothetical protein